MPGATALCRGLVPPFSGCSHSWMTDLCPTVRIEGQRLSGPWHVPVVQLKHSCNTAVLLTPPISSPVSCISYLLTSWPVLPCKAAQQLLLPEGGGSAQSFPRLKLSWFTLPMDRKHESMESGLFIAQQRDTEQCRIDRIQ